MATTKNKFVIKEDELAKWFSVPLGRLYEVVEFFDSDPDDDWDLEEISDFIFINRTLKSRIYAASGALKIAAYLDAYEQRGIFHKIKEFITRHEQRLRRSLARKSISEELLLGDEETQDSRFKYRNDRIVIYKQSLRRILGTNGASMNRAFRAIQRSVIPLEVDKDYYIIDEQYWYTGKASEAFAKHLGATLTNKSRQAMCRDVAYALVPAIENIQRNLRSADEQRQKKIETAKRQAKRRDNNRCQITKTKRCGYDKFNLTVHHLYSEKHYPQLSYNVDNLISIRENIHEEFHGWMGGYQKETTIDDFINFLSLVYPDESAKLTIRLQSVKKTLNQLLPPK